MLCTAYRVQFGRGDVRGRSWELDLQAPRSVFSARAGYDADYEQHGATDDDDTTRRPIPICMFRAPRSRHTSRAGCRTVSSKLAMNNALLPLTETAHAVACTARTLHSHGVHFSR